MGGEKDFCGGPGVRKKSVMDPTQSYTRWGDMSFICFFAYVEAGLLAKTVAHC
jgi:hypothetical protein